MSACFRSIRLVGFGVEDREVLSFLRSKLPEIFGIAVGEFFEVRLHPSWFDPSRGQFRASFLLEALLPYQKEGAILLGVTEADIYEDGLNFVFGIATPVAHLAVISTARLHNSFYGLPEDRGLFLRRILTEADHEIGHTLGLGHCENPHCVMHFSNTLVDTDRKGYRFCERCWSLIAPKLCIS